MKFFSSRKMTTALRSAFSTLAVVAVAAGAYASPLFVPVASANNGLNVSAVPNTGTLTPGQSLEIRLGDPSGTTDAVSDSCTVNNVDVNSTFHNAGPGDYRYTYTVGASDQSRAAGTIPINCTIHEAVSVTVTAFDDGNTVAIDTSSSTSTGSTPSFPTVTFAPSTGTIHQGMGLTVNLTEASNQTDVTVTGPCTVNGVDVSSGFTNNGGGSYGISYVVGSSDTERAAGTVPLSCMLGNSHGNVTVSAASTNTLAIDTNDDGTIGSSTGTTTGSLSFDVSAVPSTGTLNAGGQLEVYFDEAGNDADITLNGACTVNNVDVASSFQNLTGGLYKVVYHVGSSDTARTAGTIPVSCSLHDSGTGATSSISAFTDGNTVAIDPSSSTGGTTTTAVAPGLSMISISPASGTLVAGNTATITFTESHNQSDLTLVGPCKVNAVDVSSSFHSTGGGQYIATYTVGSSDGERPAGHIPLTCAMGNSAGSTTASSWFDGNTLAIDTNGDGTISNGTSTLGFTVTANPSTGTLNVGDHLTISLQDPLPSGDVVVGSNGCRVNDVDVAPSYLYLGNGLYQVTYTVAAGNAMRDPGTIPFDCSLQNATGSVHLVAFTDGNTVGIAETTGTTTSGGGTNLPLDFSVEAVPSTGTIHIGQNLEVYFHDANHSPHMVVNGACTVNNVDVAGSFQNLTDGLYKVTYTVGSSDTSRSAGTVPVSCSLSNTVTGATTTLAAFTDSNTVAISATTTDTDNGGNGSTTAALHVDSITQVRDTATAGGGYSAGWSWTFRITVPTDETSLSMKFADWTHSNGTDHIAAANNMRIMSAQAATTTWTTITAAGTYSDAMTLTGDLDPSTPGRQIDVTVEMQVPSGAVNGSYTTDYGVKSI